MSFENLLIFLPVFFEEQHLRLHAGNFHSECQIPIMDLLYSLELALSQAFSANHLSVLPAKPELCFFFI